MNKNIIDEYPLANSKEDEETYIYETYIKPMAIELLLTIPNTKRKEAIELKFGLRYGIRYSWEEIAKRLNLTRQDVHDIKAYLSRKIVLFAHLKLTIDYKTVLLIREYISSDKH